MTHKCKFVLRTIKDNQVQINGMIFKPDTRWLKYDGRLEEQKWCFGLYWRGDEQLPMVALWGNEEAYRTSMDDHLWNKYCKDHNLPVDAVYDAELGWYYPWAVWYTEEGQRASDEALLASRRFLAECTPTLKKETE